MDELTEEKLRLMQEAVLRDQEPDTGWMTEQTDVQVGEEPPVELSGPAFYAQQNGLEMPSPEEIAQAAKDMGTKTDADYDTPATPLNIAGDIAGGLGSGMLDIPDTPYFLKQAYQALDKSGYVPEGFKEFYGNTPVGLIYRGGEALMDKAGLDLPDELTGDKPFTDLPGLKQARDFTAPRLEPEQSDLANYGRKIAEWTGGGLPGAIRNAAVSGGKAANALLRTLGKETATGTAATGAGALAGAIDEQAGPWAEVITGLVAPSAGNQGVNALKRLGGADIGNRSAISLIESTAPQLGNSGSPGHVARLERIRESIANAPRDENNQIIGSLYDITGDDGIGQLEQLILSGKGTAEARRTIEALRGARDEATLDYVMRPLQAGGDVEPSRAAAATRIEGLNKATAAAADRRKRAVEAQSAQDIDALDEPVISAMEERDRLNAAASESRAASAAADAEAAAAAQALEEARKPVTTNRLKSVISSEASDNWLADAKLSKETDVDPAWAAHRKGPDFDATPLKKISADTLATYGPQGRKSLGNGAGLIEEGSKLADSVSPAEYDAYLSRVEDFISSNTNEAGQMNNKGRALLDYKKDLQEQYEKANPLYGAAREASSTWNTKFNPDGFNADVATIPKEQLLRKMGIEDEAGATTARLISAAEDPKYQDTLLDYLKARSDGVVDAEWLKRHEDILSNLPPEKVDAFYAANEALETSQSALAKATAAQKASEGAEKLAETGEKGVETAKGVRETGTSKLTKARKKELAAIDKRRQGLQETRGKTVLAQYANDPEKAVRGVFGSSKSQQQKTNDLIALNTAMGDLKQQESFRKSIDNYLSDFVTDSKRGTNVRDSSYEPFVKQIDSLEEAGVITRKQKTDMLAEFNEGLDISKRRENVRAFVNNIKPSESKNFISSVVAATLGSAMTGTQQLMVGAALKRNILSLMHNSKLSAREIASIETLLTNPDEFMRIGGEARVQQLVDDAISTAKIPQTAESIAEGTGGI